MVESYEEVNGVKRKRCENGVTNEINVDADVGHLFRKLMNLILFKSI